jgi:hypothetical protein
MISRKRLAITAAIIGANAFPAWTGVWQNAFNRYGYTCLQLTDYGYVPDTDPAFPPGWRYPSGRPLADPFSPQPTCYDPIWWLLSYMSFGAAFAAGCIYLGPVLFSFGRRLFAMWLRWVRYSPTHPAP